MEGLKPVRTWLEQNEPVASPAMATSRKKRGYSVLFDGSAQADKQATAEMLGREFNKDVYRVDLSEVISKYIGETEKNLAAVFKTPVIKMLYYSWMKRMLYLAKERK